MRLAAILSLAIGLVAAGPASAERIPPLAGDFAVEGVVTADDTRMPLTLRHSAGVARVEIAMQGQTMATLLDLTTRKATALIPAGGQTMVMELQLDQMPAGGNLCVTEGTRVGTSTLLGEACDEYETSKSETESPSRVCVTRDGVPLRAIEIATGRTTWMATRVLRAPQDPSLFRVPPGATRLPAGAMPGLPKTPNPMR